MRTVLKILLVRVPVWGAGVGFCAILALWMRSRSYADYVTYGRDGPDDVMLNSVQNRIEIMTEGWFESTRICNRRLYQWHPPALTWQVRSLAPQPNERQFDVLIPFRQEFQFDFFRRVRGGPHFGITFPHWAAAAALLPIWLIPTAVSLRRRSRRREGCCAKCGYDLRGNVTGVCPECGAVVAAKR